MLFINRLMLIIIYFLLYVNVISAQEIYPKNYFRSPLDIPLFLSGNFGELRSNHFHAGLDIKTGGVEGKKIYAVADGYISRIKVSPWGYGKVLYLTHPNGYVTVYAHLKSFNDSISEYVKKEQYKVELFEIELIPDPGQLPVRKGDVIAFSGNTGGSGGPHLHFEIRDEKSEKALNPFLFGFDVNDNVKPIISEIILYPLDEKSFVDNSNKPKRLALTGSLGNYKLNQPVSVHGKIGFGINTYDLHSGVHNKVGVYTIELKVNGKRKYFHKMDHFSFDHSRCLNSHTDYVIYRKSSDWFQKLFPAPNNQLTIYQDLVDRGVLIFEKDTSHLIEYLVSDYKGNVSHVSFTLQSKSTGLTFDADKKSAKDCSFFKCVAPNEFKNDQVSLNFPEGIFYEDLNFEFYSTKALKESISPVFHIHNQFVPIHSPYTLSIRIDSLPVSLRRKALVVNFDEKKGRIPIGGDLRDNWLTVSPKVLGAFTVMLDTVPPNITPLTILKNRPGLKEIKIKISDHLSGIKSYRASIDGKWILMEYEPKQSLIFHLLEKELPSGKHVFHLEVKDSRGNIAEYSSEFIK